MGSSYYESRHRDDIGALGFVLSTDEHVLPHSCSRFPNVTHGEVIRWQNFNLRMAREDIKTISA